MKLQKWKYRTCDFEWFEPCEFSKSDHNINHGCPQGCDDSGKVIDIVEATDRKEKWICWILSKEDIDMAAERIKSVKGKLSKEKYDDIARNFKKGFELANEDWGMILDEAITEAVKWQ